MSQVPLEWRGKTVPSLPVDPNWTCQRSGDCCTKPREVVMTPEEFLAIRAHLAGLNLFPDMHVREEGKFIVLKAGPCPLYAFKTCMVYPVRPYNCRRFACMRPDPTTEPYVEAMPPPGSPFDDITVVNVRIRLIRPETARVARRLLEKIQRKAQRWAVKHGWSPTVGMDGVD